MKNVATFFCFLIVALSLTSASVADVQWRTIVNKNDAVVDGDFWLNLQIKHGETDITRTLASATVDIEYTDTLNNLGWPNHVEFQGNLANTSSYNSGVTHSSDPLLYQVTIGQSLSPGVSGGGEGNPPGFDVTTGWTTAAILKWKIATATTTYIGIKNDGLGTGFFKYYNAWDGTARDATIEPQTVSGEDLGDQSLPVELSSFTASADDTKVTLKWETGSEVGNIGFYVYRSETADGPFKKISELIDGAGNSAMGRAYEYIDRKVEPNKTYFYYLEDIDIHSVRNKSDTIQVTMKPPPPKEYKLFQNYPNPFNPETWIPFQLPKAGEVTIRIYNIMGQPIKTIELGSKQAGVYTEKSKAAYWDGRNKMGEKLASGAYFYELRTETFRDIRKMILLK